MVKISFNKQKEILSNFENIGSDVTDFSHLSAVKNQLIYINLLYIEVFHPIYNFCEKRRSYKKKQNAHQLKYFWYERKKYAQRHLISYKRNAKFHFIFIW